MLEQRNLILAIVLSVAILLGFQIFYEIPRLQEEAERQALEETTAVETGETVAPEAEVDIPAPPGVVEEAVLPSPPTRQEALEREPRIWIEGPRLRGSLTLVGALIDDVTLSDYRASIDPASPEIVVFSPVAAPDRPPATSGFAFLPTRQEPPSGLHRYFAQFGWIVQDKSVRVPDSNTLWTAGGEVLTATTPVTLTWDNGSGLRFTRRIALDDDYMFTITQRVENSGPEDVTLSPYGLVSRTGTPPTLGFWILHEGPLGVFDGVLDEIDYDEIQEEGERTQKSTGGWIGITDKYWLAALVPDQTVPFTARFIHASQNGEDRYQVDFYGPTQTAPPGGAIEVTGRLFAGAKEVHLLDAYERDPGVVRFDLAVDFWWFKFIARPIFEVLHFFNRHIGNFGVAILLLTLIIKLLFFPLANKSYVAMSKMKKLQPEMMKLRDQYKEDKVRMQQELMALYKREKANPASGCLPIVIQIPVFFALYWVLFVAIEMRHAPFFGWIQDLSAPDPLSLFNLFGLLPIDPFFTLGVWPLIMGLTMLLQMRLNPQPADPTQAKIMMALPVVFTFLFATFPAGLVIYWTWNNVLSIAQQWVIMKRMGVKIGGKT